MNIEIYQAFYEPIQFALLDKAFIPYNNLENKTPWQYEYPLILDLYDKNKSYDGYWGLMSWKFSMKTGVSGEQFKTLIRNNPGYDVYHFNCFPKHPSYYLNPIMQGDAYYHQGIADYINELMKTLGYINFDIKQIKFSPEHFVFCSYYVGNSTFWNRWIVFLKTCVEVSLSNSNLNLYLSGNNSIHNETQNVPNFPFIVERLVGLFLYLHKEIISTKGFTFE